MTEIQHQLIQIIANQIFGAKADLPISTDWESILTEARQQTVFPIAYAFLEKAQPYTLVKEEYRKYKKKEYGTLCLCDQKSECPQ